MRTKLLILMALFSQLIAAVPAFAQGTTASSGKVSALLK